MIRLDTINRTLQFNLGAIATSNQLPIVVCYSDKSGNQYTGASQLSQSNNMTAVVICNAPTSNVVRDIDSVSIYNADTAPATVSISYSDGGTLYPISKSLLNPGDSLRYTHSDGWSSVDVTGSVKMSVNSDTASNLTGIPLLPNGVTTPDQSPVDNSNKLANTRYVDTAVASSITAVVGIQIDIGSKPKRGGIFNITGTGFVAGKPVLISQSAGPYIGKGTYLDEIEMDQITVAATVINNTTIQCNWGSNTYLKGFLGFNYWIDTAPILYNKLMANNSLVGVQYIMTEAGLRIAYDGLTPLPSFKIQANNGNTNNSFIMTQNGNIISYNQ